LKAVRSGGVKDHDEGGEEIDGKSRMSIVRTSRVPINSPRAARERSKSEQKDRLIKTPTVKMPSRLQGQHFYREIKERRKEARRKEQLGGRHKLTSRGGGDP
jgi:hypothetical protein